MFNAQVINQQTITTADRRFARWEPEERNLCLDSRFSHFEVATTLRRTWWGVVAARKQLRTELELPKPIRGSNWRHAR